MCDSTKFWNRMASTYHKNPHLRDNAQRNLIEMSLPYLRKKDKILDFGCGTCWASIDISPEVSKVVALDTSRKMIEVGTKYAVSKSIGNIQFINDSIHTDSLENGMFDVIITYDILHLISNTSKTIRRMHNLLKPGGIVISTTPCVGERKVVYRLLKSLSKFGVTPDITEFSRHDLINQFKKLGFSIIKVEEGSKNIPEVFIVAKKSSWVVN